MVRDFTLAAFKMLCKELQNHGYVFITFEDYCNNKRHDRYVIMRHDVDRKAFSALNMAKLEHSLGITASYYFRCINNSFSRDIIIELKHLGNEIGYHYETLVKAHGDYKKAITLFEYELKKLRETAEVKTICAHGSPFSKWDSKTLWQQYDYKIYDILGEPYSSINYNEVLYLTDTGRTWGGTAANVRDKVESKLPNTYNSTFDIIHALKNDGLPAMLLINIHPHRWNDHLLPWIKELLWQNMKNIGKRVLIKINK
jgi:hypothetical protein